MDNPNFIATIAYTVETEYRRSDNRSDAPVNGSVNTNPPAWASFSLRKLWSRFNANGKVASTAGDQEQGLGEASLNT
ncbi:MAG: hypothetical protein KF753_04080 [Caldilineaceae bacterium]|nr:hypothetical protein [Caldilineaceae bacterium]